MFRRAMACASRQTALGMECSERKLQKQLHTVMNKRNGKTGGSYGGKNVNIVNRRYLGGEEGKSPYPSQAYAFGRQVLL